MKKLHNNASHIKLDATHCKTHIITCAQWACFLLILCNSLFTHAALVDSSTLDYRMRFTSAMVGHPINKKDQDFSDFISKAKKNFTAEEVNSAEETFRHYLSIPRRFFSAISGAPALEEDKDFSLFASKVLKAHTPETINAAERIFRFYLMLPGNESRKKCFGTIHNFIHKDATYADVLKSLQCTYKWLDYRGGIHHAEEQSLNNRFIAAATISKTLFTSPEYLKLYCRVMLSKTIRSSHLVPIYRSPEGQPH